ncbi:MAG: putative lipid II flippase FtsW [Candidatus Paceibacterota bacterium]
MKKLFSRSPKPRSQPDYTFIIIVCLLVIFGLVMLASASSDIAKEEFGNSYYYLSHQVIYGLSFGIIGFILGSLIYYNKWKNFAIFLLGLNMIAMALVFTPLGISAKGASRWLDLGLFSFQPSEILKLTFLIYISSWMSKNKKRGRSFMEGALPFLLLLGGVLGLIFFQPATTTAVIIFVAAIIMYFASGAKIKYIGMIFLLALTMFSLLIVSSPYRLDRVKTFLNPAENQLGESYQINQSLIAIGSGGLTGVGYGKSTTKINYLPEPIGDSIFAVIAEELGFVGSVLLISLFISFFWRGFYIARKSSDPFGKILVIGFISIITLQAFVNMGAMSGLLPLTGVPLPFISYGGTALAVFLIMCGIIINVSRYSKN